MNRADLEKALHNWFCHCSGLAGDHAIWAKQGQSSPSSPYASLAFLTDLMRQGSEDHFEVPDALSPSDEATIGGTREFTFNCQVFGNSCLDILGNVQTKIASETAQAYLRRSQVSTFTITAGVGIYRITLNGIPTSVNIPAGQTATQIRNTILALLQANTWITSDGLQVVSSGTVAIIITSRSGEDFTFSQTANIAGVLTTSAIDLAIIQDYGVIDISPERQVGYEQAASLDIRFSTSTNIVEYTDYIEKVEITDTETGNSFIADKGVIP